jgi:hypothetical protein
MRAVSRLIQSAARSVKPRSQCRSYAGIERSGIGHQLVQQLRDAQLWRPFANIVEIDCLGEELVSLQRERTDPTSDALRIRTSIIDNYRRPRTTVSGLGANMEAARGRFQYLPTTHRMLKSKYLWFGIQRTDSQISDLHALEIGGINSVRGFREDEFLASNVENTNLDFRWLALPDAGTSLRPGVTLGTFFDWATGHDVGRSADTFSSYGLTLRLKWSPGALICFSTRRQTSTGVNSHHIPTEHRRPV